MNVNYVSSMPPTKWDLRFMRQAVEIASWSKDPSTKVGAKIVDELGRPVSEGYNGLPRGIKDTVDRLTNREIKYPATIHAELNAVLFATRPLLVGCTIYSTRPPCTRCCAVLVQKQITRVVWLHGGEDYASRWGDDVYLGRELLYEAKVAMLQIDKV